MAAISVTLSHSRAQISRLYSIYIDYTTEIWLANQNTVNPRNVFEQAVTLIPWNHDSVFQNA